MKIKYFNTAIEWSFLALIFLSAVIFDRRIGIVFSLTKTTTMRVFLIIILTIWLIKLLLGGKKTFHRTPLDWPVFSYFLAVTAATITSVQVLISFMGFYGRFEGLTSWYIFGLFFLITVQYFRGLDKLKQLIALTVPTASIMGIYGMIQRQFMDPYQWGGVLTWHRIIATIGQPNFLAAYMCMALFLSLYLFLEPGGDDRPGVVRRILDLIRPPKTDKKKPAKKIEKDDNFWFSLVPVFYYVLPILLFLLMIYSMTGEQVFLWYVFFAAMTAFSILFALEYQKLPRGVLNLILGINMVLCYIAVFYTQSRGGYLGFAVGAVLFVMMVPRQLIFSNIKKIIALAAAILMITYWVAIVQGYSPFQRYSAEISIQQEITAPAATEDPKPGLKKEARTEVELGGAAGSRGETWKSAYGIIADNPLFGIGPEVLKMVFPRYETDLFRFKETFHVKQDRCHNETFDVAVTKGLISFVLYWWIIFLVYKIGIGKWMKGDIRTKLMIAALLSSMASYIIQNQFSFGVVAIVSLFWMMWGMVMNVGSEPDPEEKKEFSLDDVPWIVIALIICVALTMIYLGTIQFRADRMFKTAKTYTEAGRLGDSLPYFERSLRILPYEGGAITHYAIAQLNHSNTLTGDARRDALIKSESTLRFGMRVDPYNADNFYIMSRIYLMMGQLNNAIDYANKALEIDPYYAEAHLTLANSYERMGQAALSRQHYQRAMEINPNLSEPKIKVAWRVFEQGDLDSAFNMFQELLMREPRNPDVHNGLGAVYMKRGDKVRAKEEFEQALVFSPGNAYAKQMLQWLK